MSHQFKPGDRVLVGDFTDEDYKVRDFVVKPGAVGTFIEHSYKEAWLVQFSFGDPLVEACSDWRWFVDHRRLTLSEDTFNNPESASACVEIANDLADALLARIGGAK